MTRALRTALVLLAVLMATSLSTSAHAAGPRIIGISLFARNDVGPGVTVQLFNSSSVDVSAACGRGAQVSPEYDDWACSPADGDYVLAVQAPAGVLVDLQCHGADGSDVSAIGTGSIALPAAFGATFCSIGTTPPASYPPIATISVNLQAPASQSGMMPTLFDGNDLDVGDALCTQHPHRIECSNVPYGSYRFGVRDAPADLHFQQSCWVTTTKLVGSGNQTSQSFTVDAALQSMQCALTAASPLVEIETVGTQGVVPVFALSGPQGTVPCPTVNSVAACGPLVAGDYQVSVDYYDVPEGSVAALVCTGRFDDSFEAFTGLGQTITINGSGIEWWACTYSVSGPSVPTTGPTQSSIILPPTTLAGSTTTTLDRSRLPDTGPSGHLLWYALGWVVLGAGLLRLTRRPVR